MPYGYCALRAGQPFTYSAQSVTPESPPYCSESQLQWSVQEGYLRSTLEIGPKKFYEDSWVTNDIVAFDEIIAGKGPPHMVLGRTSGEQSKYRECEHSRLRTVAAD